MSRGISDLHVCPAAARAAGRALSALRAALLLIALVPADVQAQLLIGYSPGPRDDARPGHDSPAYIARHVALIESRPFDGIVINDYLGRNLMNMSLKVDAPGLVSPDTGAITYEAASRSLAPVKGIFKVFRHNFAKVNMFMGWSPPPLSDDADWKTVYESAANYARAVRDSGLEGIWLDNESYHRPVVPGADHPLDYWMYRDQLALVGQSEADAPFKEMVDLARRRGRDLMRAFAQGDPEITVIVAHGPYIGCSAWRKLGSYADDRYLAGAFAAGMVEAKAGRESIVDGGELYSLRSEVDFRNSYDWRKGVEVPGFGHITDLDPGVKCPFMDPALASHWRGAVGIAFGTFDKQREPGEKIWSAITDASVFRTTLTNALRATDRYVWFYTEWQDWWGTSTEDRLGPWIDAIKAARRQ